MPEIPNVARFDADHQLLLTRYLPAPPERVWRAITEKAELDQWFMVTEMELKEGARFSFEQAWDGTIGALSPGRHIQFDADEGGISRFEIEAEGEGTRFRLIDRLAPDYRTEPAEDAEMAMLSAQPGGPGTHWPGVAAGWHGFVDALESHLGGSPEAEDYMALSQRYHDHMLALWSDAKPN